MEASVVEAKQNEAVLHVDDEDISVMYILQHELLANKKVEFAGFALKHPLIGQYDLRVVTESGNPLDAIIESTEAAREYVASLTKAMQSKLKG